MQNVVVVFTADGKVIVVPEDQAAKSGQLIDWTVVNYNSAVFKVKIEFTPARSYFGISPLGGPHYIEKNVKGTLTIWGEAPPVGGGKMEAQKYTVSGLGSGGNTLVHVDPRIVVTEP